MCGPSATCYASHGRPPLDAIFVGNGVVHLEPRVPGLGEEPRAGGRAALLLRRGQAPRLTKLLALEAVEPVPAEDLEEACLALRRMAHLSGEEQQLCVTSVPEAAAGGGGGGGGGGGVDEEEDKARSLGTPLRFKMNWNGHGVRRTPSMQADNQVASIMPHRRRDPRERAAWWTARRGSSWRRPCTTTVLQRSTFRPHDQATEGWVVENNKHHASIGYPAFGEAVFGVPPASFSVVVVVGHRRLCGQSARGRRRCCSALCHRPPW